MSITIPNNANVESRRKLALHAAVATSLFLLSTIWYSDSFEFVYLFSGVFGVFGVIIAAWRLLTSHARRRACGQLLVSMALLWMLSPPMWGWRQAVLALRHHVQFAIMASSYRDDIQKSAAPLHAKRTWRWGSRLGQMIELVYDPSDATARAGYAGTPANPCRVIITTVGPHFYVRDDACP